MAFDIAVLQDKYGANTTFANGNSTYTLPDKNGVGTYWACIWDTGGTDTCACLCPETAAHFRETCS